MERLRSRWPRVGIATLVALINVVAFSLLVAEQATEWSTSWDAVALLWWVGGVSLVIGLVTVAVVMALGALTTRWWPRLTAAVLVSLLQAGIRTWILLPVTTARGLGTGTGTVWLVGATGYAVALGAGFLVAALLQREEDQRCAREEESARAAHAIAELEDEELRVRRLVADRLHGEVQQSLVFIAGGLDQVAAELDGELGARWSGQLRDWAQDLDRLREEAVRSLSHRLFPSEAELGTYEAIRALLDRLPTTVATSFVLGPRLQEAVRGHTSPLPLVDRLVVVYTVEEAVTNALKHGGARTVTVRAEIEAGGPTGWELDVVVDDDGSGPGEGERPFSGLARHRSRVRTRGGTLVLTGNETGGGRLHLRMPFTPAVELNR